MLQSSTAAGRALSPQLRAGAAGVPHGWEAMEAGCPGDGREAARPPRSLPHPAAHPSSWCTSRILLRIPGWWLPQLLPRSLPQSPASGKELVEEGAESGDAPKASSEIRAWMEFMVQKAKGGHV